MEEEEGKTGGCSFAAVKLILWLIATEKYCSSSASLSAAALHILAALCLAALLSPSSELVQAAKEKTLFCSTIFIYLLFNFNLD